MSKTLGDYAREQAARPEAALLRDAARAAEIIDADDLERAAMTDKPYVILLDGKPINDQRYATYSDACIALQRLQGQSLDRALRHEGYSIIERES